MVIVATYTHNVNYMFASSRECNDNHIDGKMRIYSIKCAFKLEKCKRA